MLTKTGYFSPLTPKKQLKNFYQIGGWVGGFARKNVVEMGGSDQHMTRAIGRNARGVGGGCWRRLRNLVEILSWQKIRM